MKRFFRFPFKNPFRPARPSLARRAGRVLLAVSLCGLAVLWFVAQTLVASVSEAEIREQIAARIFSLSLSYGQGGIVALVREIEQLSDIARVRGDDSLYLFLDEQGRVLAGTYGYTPSPLQGLYPGEHEVNLQRSGLDETTTAFAISIFRIDRFTFIIGQSLEFRDQLHQRLRIAFATVFFPIAIILGLILGRITRHLFARLETMAATAREVGAGRLTERMVLTGSGDEFDRLSQTLNEMLERNETLTQALRTTTIALAHDLRTPLTRAYARLEEATRLLGTPPQEDGSPQDESRDTEAGSTLKAARAEIGQLRRTFDALITIVHAESGISAAFPDVFSYSELLEDIHDLYAPVAEEKNITFSLSLPPAQHPAQQKTEAELVRGNRQLLVQALSNLVENALAHLVKEGGADKAEITLFLRAQEASARTANPPQQYWHLGVSDTGAGISQHAKQRALAGFLRSGFLQDGLPEGEFLENDFSKSVPAPLSSSNKQGHGLGLILAAAIARLHGGELVLQNKSEMTQEEQTEKDTHGLVATLVLPEVPEVPESPEAKP